MGCLRVLHCGFNFLLFRARPEPARAATPHMQVSRIAQLGFAKVFRRAHTRDARVRRVTVDSLALGSVDSAGVCPVPEAGNIRVPRVV